MKSKSNVPLVNESPEDGWVERQVIRNQVRVTRDKVSRLVGRHMEDLILEVFDALEANILKHSKGTEQILMGKNALLRPGDPRAAEAAPDQREAHALRLAMMKARL